ncbi:DUF4232 domain-containing protein [Streptomyces sp. V2I9]|uniref:DUF4232 domain-containing protein n=1 Tax=Streptomyces sp. V2I9 TaxID=3042304 RepID=UPI0027826D3F|nr:DUF4232 domain-containing protein [Streptomyces sp. V2I9]MDQ0986665.1 hypothetical protein [Streptomyces sp. V2I9]
MNSKVTRSGSSRRGLRGAVLGAAVVAALLTTTACQPSESDEKAAAPSAVASSGDSGTGSGSPKDGETKDGGETGVTGETGGGNGTAHADCEADGLTTAVELQDGPSETPRHFLLTVTNNANTPCVLNDAPTVRLVAGNDAPIVESLGSPEEEEQDTEPLVVEGGGKAYAGLYVFGNDEGGEAEYDQSDRFTATLTAGEGTELSGTLIFDLPEGLDTVSVDDAARVNGWAGTEGLAMRAITQL